MVYNVLCKCFKQTAKMSRDLSQICASVKQSTNRWNRRRQEERLLCWLFPVSEWIIIIRMIVNLFNITVQCCVCVTASSCAAFCNTKARSGSKFTACNMYKSYIIIVIVIITSTNIIIVIKLLMSIGQGWGAPDFDIWQRATASQNSTQCHKNFYKKKFHISILTWICTYSSWELLRTRPKLIS